RYAAVYEKGSGRWLFTWTPWQTGLRLPDGAAFVLSAGAVLTLEVAYRGTDEAVTATGEIGLYRADGAAKPAIVRTVAMEKPRTLAPGAPPLRARAELVLEETVTIAALW